MAARIKICLRIALSAGIWLGQGERSNRVSGQDSTPQLGHVVHASLTLEIGADRPYATHLDIAAAGNLESNQSCRLRIPFGVIISDPGGLNFSLKEETPIIAQRPQLQHALLSFDVSKSGFRNSVKLRAKPCIITMEDRQTSNMLSNGTELWPLVQGREQYGANAGLRFVADRNPTEWVSMEIPWSGTLGSQPEDDPVNSQSNYFVIEERGWRRRLRFRMSPISADEILPEQVQFEFPSHFAIGHSNAFTHGAKVDKVARNVIAPSEFFEENDELFIEYEQLFSPEAKRLALVIVVSLLGCCVPFGLVASSDFIPRRRVRIGLMVGVPLIVGLIAITIWALRNEPLVTRFQMAVIFVLLGLSVLIGATWDRWRHRNQSPPPLPLSETGESDMLGLQGVAGFENPARLCDVVFLHGLDGNARSTWHSAGRPDDFWPAWLGVEAELSQVGIWTLGYDVASSAWRGTSMPLVDRATNTIDLFELDGIGQRPLAFVCHSLGGLLAKQVLRQSSDSTHPRYRAIAEQTKLIVFFSTPHSGSNIANWIKHIGTLLRSTVSIEELQSHDAHLRDLNLWYRDHAVQLDITTFVYCEKKPTWGVLVVDETSADPGIPGVRPVPLGENHSTICKPASKRAQTYRRVKRLILEHVLPVASATTTSPVMIAPANAINSTAHTFLPAPLTTASNGNARDIFVSYNRADKAWAEWIAWTLEEAGYTVVIQAWDFRPGGDFVVAMHRAAALTERTIAVLSDHYLQAEFTQPEWAVAFAKDPQGKDRKLIPVRVAPCQVTGLLLTRVYVDLVGLSSDDARSALLGAFSERAKPISAPAFPGGPNSQPTAVAQRVAPSPIDFPGESPVVSGSRQDSAATPSPQTPRDRHLKPDERLDLIQRLNQIPPQQFNMLLFALNPPGGLIPPMPAPQADRAAALLGWAEGSGCGLNAVLESLVKILGDH